MLFYVEKEYSDFAAVATSMWPGLTQEQGVTYWK